MTKKNTTLLAAGLIFAGILTGALLLADYLFQPIIIEDEGKISEVRAAVWNTGQALYAAGITLRPGDQVQPSIDQPARSADAIRIQRAAHILVWEDGKAQQIESLKRTAGEILAEADIHLDPGDHLKWNGQILPLEENLPVDRPVVIQVQRATEVLVDTGEAVSPVQSQGPTVAHALWNAGVEVGPGDRLSQPPGELLEPGDQVAYLPAQPLTIQMEEQEVQVYSAAETVGEALAEAGISLQGLDYSQPAEDQPLPTDGVLQILHVNEEIILGETLVSYQSKYEPDHELELDKQRTLVPGQYGVQVIRERVRYEDGQEVSREIDGEWVAAEPQDQTIGYGTKPIPQVMDTTEGQIEYWRAVRVYATSYSPCRLGTGDGRCGYITSSGRTLTKGIVAVTLTWYRMMAGQQVYVPGYGRGVIADVGGGIPGTPWIDLGFEDHDYQPMVGWMTMYFLTPIPANVPWILP